MKKADAIETSLLLHERCLQIIWVLQTNNQKHATPYMVDMMICAVIRQWRVVLMYPMIEHKPVT